MSDPKNGPVDTAELRRLLAAATPGPVKLNDDHEVSWCDRDYEVVSESRAVCVATFEDEDDMRAYIALRNQALAILDELEAIREAALQLSDDAGNSWEDECMRARALLAKVTAELATARTYWTNALADRETDYRTHLAEVERDALDTACRMLRSLARPNYPTVIFVRREGVVAIYGNDDEKPVRAHLDDGPLPSEAVKVWRP